MKHIIALVLVLLSTAVPVFSQSNWNWQLIDSTPLIPTGSIHVQVIDSLTGNPMSAFVEVTDPRQIRMWWGLVNEEVIINNLVVVSSFPYTVQAAWIGYFLKSVPAIISSNCTTNVVISLVPIPPPTISTTQSTTQSSSFKISLTKTNSKTEIFDISGKRVANLKKSGIYFFHLGDGNVVKKLIIK